MTGRPEAQSPAFPLLLGNHPNSQPRPFLRTHRSIIGRTSAMSYVPKSGVRAISLLSSNLYYATSYIVHVAFENRI